MKFLRFTIPLILILTLTGCNSFNKLGMRRFSGARVADVSPVEFERLYHLPRTALSHYDYKGVQKNYHILDFYTLGHENEVKLQKVVRAPVHAFPPDFPDQAQKSLQKKLKPRTYLDFRP